MHTLFQSVIWPAIAGNIAWAFFTVLIQEWECSGQFYSSRLWLLAAMVIYLCLDWTHTKSIEGKLRKWYWLGDLILAPTIAAVAIAAQAQAGDGRWFLAAVFAASSISHLGGAWTPRDIDLYRNGKWKNRLSWLILNGLALWIVFGLEGSGNQWGWNLFHAAALVICCWALAKPGNLKFLRWLHD